MAIIPASGVDRRLMNAAATLTATPEDLSKSVNGQLTPAQAYSRVVELLDKVTQFDAHQQRVLLLVRMSNYLGDLQDKGIDPKYVPSVTRMFKLLSDQVERANADIGEISTRLAKEQARYFVEGYMRATEFCIKELSTRNEIEVDETEFMEIAEMALSVASEYIDTVTERELE